MDAVANSPFEYSELAAALGTLELKRGNARIGRRFVRASIIEPTENAVAQASWVNRRVTPIELPDDLAGTQRCYEALAWEKANDRDIRSAVENCRLWLDEEPFNAKPAILGSFFGVVSGDCISEAVEIAQSALRANGGSTLLRNNLAVGLAELGMIDRAREVLSVIRVPRCSEEVKALVSATRGLIAFRSGDFEAGEGMYREAQEIARRVDNRYLYDLAEIHLGMEMLRVDMGRRETLTRVVEENSDSGEVGLELAVERARRLLKETPTR